MWIRRLAIGGLALFLVACAPRYRREMVGTSSAGVATAAPAGRVAIEAGGLHQLDLVVSMPQAMQVDYTIRCPGAEQTGRLGESFEAYRARRLAELERERQRQKQAVGTIAGALLGSASAGAAVQSPVGDARVEGAVDGEAAGEAVADAALAEPQLPPGDVGAGVHRAAATLQLADRGACMVTLQPVLEGAPVAGLSGSLSVQRLVDVRAEKRQARIAADRAAVQVRGDIKGALIARGADPEKRARERAAAQARADAQARARAEIRWRAASEEKVRARAQRRAELEVEYAAARRVRLERDAALAVRGRVTLWLTECGGDPHRRARLEQERRQRERQIVQLSIEARLRLRGRLLALGADPQWRRKQAEADLRAFELRSRQRADAQRRAEQALRLQTSAALEARAALKSRLVIDGAIDRPPMPAPEIEQPGTPPFSGAVWVSGSWQWVGESWTWLAGSWAEPPEAEAVWVAPTRVEIGGVVIIRAGAWMSRKGKRIRVKRRRRR